MGPLGYRMMMFGALLLIAAAFELFSQRKRAAVERKMRAMDEAAIKHMVDRFLGWKLPDNFNPDAGISFKKTFNEHTSHPMKHEPTGTNLLDYTQAEQMVRYMIDGMPSGERP